MLDHKLIIEVKSEEHEKAIRKRAYELGYTKWNVETCPPDKCNYAWDEIKRTGESHSISLEKEGNQEYASTSWYAENFPHIKRGTLDDLYPREEVDPNAEIRKEIRKEIEELEKKLNEIKRRIK